MNLSRVSMRIYFLETRIEMNVNYQIRMLYPSFKNTVVIFQIYLPGWVAALCVVVDTVDEVVDVAITRKKIIYIFKNRNKPVQYKYKLWDKLILYVACSEAVPSTVWTSKTVKRDS